MAKNPVKKVLTYVMGKYVSTERFREGLRTGTRASFHMESEDAAVVLKYIEAQQNGAPEAAGKTFVECRDEVVQSKAKSPKDTGFFGGLLIAIVATGFAAGLLLPMTTGTMLSVAALAAVLLIFFALVLALAWQPRRRAMDKIWAQELSLEKKLEELHALQETPLMQVIGEYQKPQGIIFAVLALCAVIGLPGMLWHNVATAQAFHDEMSAVVVSADNAGTRYVVYDEDAGRYVDKYLDDAKQAKTAAEVCGVLHIKKGEVVVGRYEGQGNAYQRYVTIELVDQRTGRTVARETIYGGEPPMTISVKSGARNQNGYGSHPSTEDIARTCEDMIYTFERSGK